MVGPSLVGPASGGGGIRTRGPRERTPVFKCAATSRCTVDLRPLGAEGTPEGTNHPLALLADLVRATRNLSSRSRARSSSPGSVCVAPERDRGRARLVLGRLVPHQ